MPRPTLFHELTRERLSSLAAEALVVLPVGATEQHGPHLAVGTDFPMGTDSLGRDVLSRTIHGAQVSLQVAAIAVGAAIVLGLLAGLTGALYGGLLDNVAMRIVDITFAVPDPGGSAQPPAASSARLDRRPARPEPHQCVGAAWWPTKPELMAGSCSAVPMRRPVGPDHWACLAALVS